MADNKKSLLGLLSIIALITVASIVLLSWILGLLDINAETLNRVVDLILRVALLIGLAFIAIYAYGWAKETGTAWIIIYIISLIIAIAFIFLGFF